MSNLLRTFPNNPPLFPIHRTENHYIISTSGHRFLDATAGGTAYAVIGYNNDSVNSAISRQLKLYNHVDYKSFEDPLREELAALLCSSTPLELDRVMLSGGSGGEACEMALQISYQTHCEMGNNKKACYLSRQQSYHGSTSGALSLGERPNLEFYRPILSNNRHRLSEFNYLKNRLDGESVEAYSQRLLDEFQSVIDDLGAENIGGFVAETIMGGLVGDVPASREYWAGIRKLCTQNNIHLIIDEVWCGTGVSGKINCVEWYDFTPDFLILGKTLAAGYVPLSAVLINSAITSVISSNSGRFETSCTFQGHSLACSAALAVQKIIRAPGFVETVCQKGEYIRSTIQQELGNHDFFHDVRGLGVRNTLEYVCPEQNLFGQYVASKIKEKHNILVSGKWHRFNLSHAMTFSYDEIDQLLSALFAEFNQASALWTNKFYSNIVPANFF